MIFWDFQPKKKWGGRTRQQDGLRALQPPEAAWRPGDQAVLPPARPCCPPRLPHQELEVTARCANVQGQQEAWTAPTSQKICICTLPLAWLHPGLRPGLCQQRWDSLGKGKGAHRQGVGGDRGDPAVPGLPRGTWGTSAPRLNTQNPCHEDLHGPSVNHCWLKSCHSHLTLDNELGKHQPSPCSPVKASLSF